MDSIKFKMLDNCGTREDAVVSGSGKTLYSSRHSFQLPSVLEERVISTCRSIAQGRPYYFIGIKREFMGRKFVDYRVDIYPNELTHVIGMIREKVNKKFWQDVYPDIVN